MDFAKRAAGNTRSGTAAGTKGPRTNSSLQLSSFPLSLLFCDDVTASSPRSERRKTATVNGLVKVNDNVLLRFSARGFLSAVCGKPATDPLDPKEPRESEIILSPTWN